MDAVTQLKMRVSADALNIEIVQQEPLRPGGTQ